MILLVIGSSTEPALFHAGCRPCPQVGLLPALISGLLVRKARPALTSDLLIRKAHPTLTSDHVVNYNHIRNAPHSHLSWKELNPLTMTEWLSLTSYMEGTESSHHDRMAYTHI